VGLAVGAANTGAGGAACNASAVAAGFGGKAVLTLDIFASSAAPLCRTLAFAVSQL